MAKEVLGYGRVSSAGQNIETQREMLIAAGCTKLFLEKKSGSTTAGREELARALDTARAGDEFVVTRLDRLARSTGDLLDIMKKLEAKGVAFKCTEQPGVNTTGHMGKLLLTILGAFAEFENGIRKERQMDGIARAKDEGVYKGRPAKIKANAIRALQDEGFGATDIAKKLNISRASVYRVLEANAAA